MAAVILCLAYFLRKLFPAEFSSMLIIALIFLLVLLIRLFYIVVNTKYIKTLNECYSKGREALIDKIISDIKNDTETESIKLIATREATSVFSSKFGGVPYIPPGFVYPLSLRDGKPLRFLAQLNFEKLPKLKGFPRTGILQFFIADNDMYGLGEPLNFQEDFRVIFHPDIIRDKALLEPLPVFPVDEDSLFPFEGEFSVDGLIENSYITVSDFRFPDMVLGRYNAAFSKQETDFYKLPRDVSYKIFHSFNAEGHRMGGYPIFTQSDPREDNKFSDYTVLLLQIDSDNDIMWGDVGVANFFIMPQKLQGGDFSDVLYSWDCG
jgi:uncharacterized protein YwqG